MVKQFWVKLSVWIAGWMILQTILLLVTLIVPISGVVKVPAVDDVAGGIGYLTTLWGQPMMGQGVRIECGEEQDGEPWWEAVEDVTWE